MNKTRTLALLIWAAVTLASPATAKKPKPEKPEGDFFPLRVGDSWTYRNNESGGYTLKVLKEEPQEGGALRYLVERRSEVIIQDTFSKAPGWVLFHGENYPEHEGLKIAYEPPRQYLPNPLVAGQKWEWTGKDTTQTEHHETTRVVGFDNVTVAAGKFRAMKVISEISGGSATIVRTTWYAPGIGLVKSATEAGQIKYGFELTDYSSKKVAK